MKKTLTPLNDVYMRAALHMKRARDDMFNHHEDALTQQATIQRAYVAIVPKSAMK
jgi:hypothetical protein